VVVVFRVVVPEYGSTTAERVVVVSWVAWVVAGVGSTTVVQLGRTAEAIRAQRAAMVFVFMD